MKSLCMFNFYALSVLDGEKEEIKIDVKGYKSYEDNKTIYYFKHDNSYKFIVDDDLIVYVNNSIYHFNLNKKTEALIRIDNYSKTCIMTQHTKMITDLYNMCEKYDLLSLKQKNILFSELLVRWLMK